MLRSCFDDSSKEFKDFRSKKMLEFLHLGLSHQVTPCRSKFCSQIAWLDLILLSDAIKGDSNPPWAENFLKVKLNRTFLESQTEFVPKRPSWFSQVVNQPSFTSTKALFSTINIFSRSITLIGYLSKKLQVRTSFLNQLFSYKSKLWNVLIKTQSEALDMHQFSCNSTVLTSTIELKP